MIHETIQTFKQRGALFKGHSRFVKAYDEGRARELDASEHVKLEATVLARYNYLLNAVSRDILETEQVDQANAKARGSLTLGDKEFKDIPATTLLHIENMLRDLQKVVLEMPTRESGVDWIPADEVCPGAFKTAHADVTQKTEKIVYGVTLAAATDKHPAQVSPQTKDSPVANITKVSFSGALSSAEKNRLLDRVTELFTLVSQARTIANVIDVPAENTALASAIQKFLTDI